MQWALSVTSSSLTSILEEHTFTVSKRDLLKVKVGLLMDYGIVEYCDPGEYDSGFRSPQLNFLLLGDEDRFW